LLRREQDAGWAEDDQMIHAVVLDLPGGQVEAAADWRMRDHFRYLWPLGGGRFLVRQGNVYSTTDRGLALKPWLISSSVVLTTDVSPDGHRLVTEDEYERHTPEEHKKLVEEAQSADSPPPEEDTLISLVDLDTRAVLGRMHVELPVDVPITGSGYLRPEKGAGDDDYVMRFVPFAGQETTLGDVRSTCSPRETFLNDKAVMIASCGPDTTDTYLDAWTIDGKKLWSGRRDGHAVWPTFARAANGSRFAVGVLRILHTINLDDSLDDEDVQGQLIQVFDVSTGALLLSVDASPVQSAGQNFALSPDGSQLAVLRDGAIEVYAVPNASPAPEEKEK
jgi:WD40 repeat protein